MMVGYYRFFYLQFRRTLADFICHNILLVRTMLRRKSFSAHTQSLDTRNWAAAGDSDGAPAFINGIMNFNLWSKVYE